MASRIPRPPVPFALIGNLITGGALTAGAAYLLYNSVFSGEVRPGAYGRMPAI
jgi:hypothetical protein